MRRLIAISFLFVFLTANTSFGQLLGLPTFIHHYLEHVENKNKASLTDFLKSHYVSKFNHPDDKHHDHQKLPFKTTHCHSSHIITIAPQPFILAFQTTVGNATIIYNQQNYSNFYLNSIWQPPRFC